MNKKLDYELLPNAEYGFLQASPTPSKDEITKFYANEFYSGEYKNFNNSSLEVQIADKDFFDGQCEDILYNISKVLKKPVEGLRILDVGCGWAQALLYFKNKGMDCYGFDPAPEAIEYGLRKGLSVQHAGIDRMDVFGSIKFDVVMLKNVLEHLPNPFEVLKEIHQKVLKEGGLLIIDVPNEFNVFQTAGRDVHGLGDWWVAPPGHLNYFSKDTLVNLINGAGYEVCLSEASFPLEMFLLFNDCYVKNREIGKEIHKKRVNFEMNLRKLGHADKLHEFYQALAKINLGRQIAVYALSSNVK
jgi:2-polyprenyl-3-methyl-5-hydroxy-6-metoxy-1,4-benzoquinol methylase